MDEAMTIATFLQRRPGRFCDRCLGDLLGIASEDVKAEIFSRSREFARIYGSCSLCRQRAAVTAQRLAA
jgi:hypothetical protein